MKGNWEAWRLNDAALRRITHAIWYWYMAHRTAVSNAEQGAAYEELEKLVQFWESHRIDVMDHLQKTAQDAVMCSLPKPIIIKSNGEIEDDNR